MNKKKWLAAFLLAITPVLAWSSTQILLYKHHSIDSTDWATMSEYDSGLVESGTWTGPGDAQASTNTAPDTPTFTATAYDSSGTEIGTL